MAEQKRKPLVRDGYAVPHELIAFLLDELERDSVLVEFGSGFGTAALASYLDVTSIEDQAEWCGLVAQAEYIHAPLHGNWYNHAAIERGLPSSWDAVLVDGPANQHIRSGVLSFDAIWQRPALWVIDDCQCLAIRKLAKRIGERCLIRPLFFDCDGGRQFAAIDARDNGKRARVA